MTTFITSFRAEVARLAKRETKAMVEPLKRANARYRKDIAALRREMTELQRQLRQTARQPVQQEAAEPDGRPIRFRADGVKSLRERLGLSAADFGTLVGVSGQTVYNWERGVKPRRAQLERIAEVRGIGKREARARLS